MLKRALIRLFFFLLSAGLCASQTKSRDAEGHEWWQHAVFYEIYPRSCADSNNDGIGDLKGDPQRKEDVKDPIGKLGWPAEKGRDGERTLMQWKKNEPNAGFSKSAPWLPVPASYATHNVETELKDPGSILNFYKRIRALRHTNPALIEGAYIPLNQDDPNVLSYLRTYKGKAVLVALNMSNSGQKVTFDLAEQGFSAAKLKPLAASQAEAVDSGLSLQPFGAFVGEVVK